MSPDVFYEIDDSNQRDRRPTIPMALHSELSRLVCAALVSHEFRHLLFSNPARALAVGYGGEKFCLTRRERESVLSIRTNSLQEFAARLVVAMDRETVPAAVNPALPLTVERESVSVTHPSPYEPVSPWA